jgi:hypothetical protein
MAITNAQQFKQLVNPPMDGKRPGYRGEAAAASDRAAGRNAGRDTSPAGTGNVGGDFDRDSFRDAVRRGELKQLVEKKEAEKKEELVERFRNKQFQGVNFPGLIGTTLNLAGPLVQKGMRVNRNFFLDKVLGSKNFKDIDFANLTPSQQEELYGDYMSGRLSGEIDAYGNPLNTKDDRGQALPIIPQTISNMTADAADADANEKENVGRMFRLLADGGMTEDAPVGGIMDIESGRQMYFLGKLVKKATRAVKKIVKSPIGKAALIGGLGYLGAQTGFGSQLLTDFKKLSALKKAGVIGGGLLAAAPFFMKQEEDDEEDIDRGPGLEIDRIRANPYLFTPRRFAAEGGSMKEPVAKKTMPLIDMDGKEKDYRETGGFVDMGRMERADDVPARLSKNEFVFTADAVRNAGDGSVDKGAEVMYNMMKNLESGGDVSEESQGLDGARKMFQTSQRLGEVL